MSRTNVTAYIVSGAWSLALFLAGVRLPGVEAKVLGFLPLLIVAIFAIFDNWLWRLGFIKHVSQRPDLGGTWKGELISRRADQSGAIATHPAKEIFIVIRQSYLNLSVILLSDQGKSRSIAAMIQKNSSDDFTAYYHYTSSPDLHLRGDNPMHDGGTKLEISGLAPSSLGGEYWTNRLSIGTFTAQRVSRKRYGDYATAKAELDGGN